MVIPPMAVTGLQMHGMGMEGQFYPNNPYGFPPYAGYSRGLALQPTRVLAPPKRNPDSDGECHEYDLEIMTSDTDQRRQPTASQMSSSTVFAARSMDCARTSTGVAIFKRSSKSAIRTAFRQSS